MSDSFSQAFLEHFKEQRAILGYQNPEPLLGHPKHYIDHATEITHKGQLLYLNGPTLINLQGITLPQEDIDQQHQSIKDALSIIFPKNLLKLYVETFFSNDFTQNSYFQESINTEIPEDFLFPEDSFLLADIENQDFTDKTRRHNTGESYYTLEELNIIKNGFEKNPKIHHTLLAYQSCFKSYLDEARMALENDKDINTENQTGVKIINTLKDEFSSNNFTSQIAPMLYLTLENQKEKTITNETFKDGFNNAFKAGYFESNLKNPDNSQIKITCPARHLLATTNSTLLENNNTLLFNIYQKLKETPYDTRPDVKKTSLKPSAKHCPFGFS